MPTESFRNTPAPPSVWEGWRGILFIAATYVYFLIFAQFGFLERRHGFIDFGLIVWRVDGLRDQGPQFARSTIRLASQLH